MARAAKALSAFAVVALVALVAPSGASAIATLSPTYYDFGPTALNSSKTIRFELSTSCADDPAQQNFQCLVPGGEPPLPVSISVAGGFSQTNNCPSSMTRNEVVAVCSIFVSFAPTALGPFQGRLDTGEDAPSSSLGATGTPAVKQPPKKKCRKAAKPASASAKAKPKKCLRRKGKR